MGKYFFFVIAFTILFSCKEQYCEQTPLSFEIDFHDVDDQLVSDTLQIDVIPSSGKKTDRYYCGFIQKDKYHSDEILLDSDFYKFNKMAEDSGKSLDEILSVNLFYGERSFSYDVKRGIKDYIFYVYQVFDDNTIGEFTKVDFSYPQPDPANFTVELDVKEISYKSARLIVTPSDVEKIYYMDCVEASEVDKFEDDGQFIEWYFKTYEVFISYLLKVGSRDFTYDYLFPGTDYYLIAVGVDSETLEPDTKVFKKAFSTLAESYENFDCEINVRQEQLKCMFEVIPSSNSIYYYFNVIEGNADDLDELNYRAQFESHMDSLHKASPDIPMSELILLNLFSGKSDMEDKVLKPSTEYVAWCVACSEDGDFCSEIIKEPFSTLPYTQSELDVAVSVSLKNYFWGNELNEINPSWLYEDRIVTVHETESIGEDVREWFLYTFEGDYTDPDKYPDWQLINTIYSQPLLPKMEDGQMPVEPITWYLKPSDITDDVFTYTYLVVSIDVDGYYGEIIRLLYDFTESGAGSAEEWFDYNLD